MLGLSFVQGEARGAHLMARLAEVSAQPAAWTVFQDHGTVCSDSVSKGEGS